MKDIDCVTFLQWALPRLQMRWAGFRKVRGQVCKRIDRRLHELQLENVADYRGFLQQHAEEWSVLDHLCTVTISRFYRDKGLFRFLENQVFPKLAEVCLSEGRKTISVWSTGCASGEEPYSIALLWNRRLKTRFTDIQLNLLATDIHQPIVDRAKNGCYSFSSIKDLPVEWREDVFIRQNEVYCLIDDIKDQVQFRCHDIRKPYSLEPVDLILCMNLVFTYYNSQLQIDLGKRLLHSLRVGGFLVLGAHENLPEELTGLFDWPEFPGIYRLKKH